jgi:hypothetical protein
MHLPIQFSSKHLNKKLRKPILSLKEDFSKDLIKISR